jgi:hypothetical protein
MATSAGRVSVFRVGAQQRLPSPFRQGFGYDLPRVSEIVRRQVRLEDQWFSHVTTFERFKRGPLG